MNYYILEWNILNDSIELYEFQSKKHDIAEVYEEISEELHNFSSVLVMNLKQMGSLFDAVATMKRNLKKQVKGGFEKHGR